MPGGGNGPIVITPPPGVGSVTMTARYPGTMKIGPGGMQNVGKSLLTMTRVMIFGPAAFDHIQYRIDRAGTPKVHVEWARVNKAGLIVPIMVDKSHIKDLPLASSRFEPIEPIFHDLPKDTFNEWIRAEVSVEKMVERLQYSAAHDALYLKFEPNLADIGAHPDGGTVYTYALAALGHLKSLSPEMLGMQFRLLYKRTPVEVVQNSVFGRVVFKTVNHAKAMGDNSPASEIFKTIVAKCTHYDAVEGVYV